ncbi:MAG: Tab2/Atab2 family RNA-binding protein [Prochlorotrichaceae cyanobacterium]
MNLIWELDFYSRPILDESGKRLWEVVICEAPIRVDGVLEDCFTYTEFCPNTQVNSLWLQGALERAIQQSGSKPTQIRFFRRQMNNMITKTCGDLGIPCVVSRRTIVLNRHLKHRFLEVYPQEPGYEDKPVPSVQYPQENPQTLPDPLQGEQWRIVTLPLASIQEMPEWEISFAEAFPLALLDLAADTPIPGLIIYSGRSLPLAAWMSGLELGFLSISEQQPPQLLLETGGSDRWVLANLPNPDRLAEARAFEQTKQQADGVHFLAIQANPDSEAFSGFWLFKELKDL